MINVRYINGKRAKVDLGELDALIESRKISAFERHDGWAEIGKAKLRRKLTPINRHERRVHSSQFISDSLSEDSRQLEQFVS